jgi:hypothetical protein
MIVLTVATAPRPVWVVCLSKISKCLSGRGLFLLHNSRGCSFLSRHCSQICLRSSIRALRSSWSTFIAKVNSIGLLAFAPVRPRLFGIAYRMLGSAAEAEDVVQDVWMRWQSTNRTAIENPPAYLATTTTRLCINLARYYGLGCLKCPAASFVTLSPTCCGRTVSHARCRRKDGGREGIRTPGLLIANEGKATLRRGSTIT